MMLLRMSSRTVPVIRALKKKEKKRGGGGDNKRYFRSYFADGNNLPQLPWTGGASAGRTC